MTKGRGRWLVTHKPQLILNSCYFHIQIGFGNIFLNISTTFIVLLDASHHLATSLNRWGDIHFLKAF